MINCKGQFKNGDLVVPSEIHDRIQQANVNNPLKIGSSSFTKTCSFWNKSRDLRCASCNMTVGTVKAEFKDGTNVTITNCSVMYDLLDGIGLTPLGKLMNTIYLKEKKED